MLKFLENSDHSCGITFTNDPDKYTEESFLEINQFFLDHDIPFADGFFFEPKYNPHFNYQSHTELIEEFISKGRIEILHGMPDISKYAFRNDIQVYTDHGHHKLSYLEIRRLQKAGIKYLSTNLWYDVDFKECPIDITGRLPDFKRYHTKFNRRERTSQWDFFPKIYSIERVNTMKEVGNVYFGYMHMSHNKHPFTEEAKNTVLRIANDDEVLVTTTKNMIELCINELLEFYDVRLDSST